MLKDEAIQNKEHEHEISPDNFPELKEIGFQLFLSLLGFIVTILFFSTWLFDIEGYMEDHNMDFKWMGYLVLFFFLIVFYALPFLFLKIFNRSTPGKISDNCAIYYTSGLLLAVIYILIVSVCIFIRLKPVQGEESGALWTTIVGWLLSIFVINILFASSGFQNFIFKRISRFIKSISKEVDSNEE